MRISILFIAALSAISATQAPAQDTVRQSVQVNDLDLASPAGRARFERRVRTALETVCGSYAGAPAYEVPEIGRCRAVARAQLETRLAARSARGENPSLGTR